MKEKDISEYVPSLDSTMEEKDAFLLNPLVLAFVGDCVQSLAVRTQLAENSDMKAGELHKLCVQQVKAVTQCKMADSVLAELTERENDVFRRARNTKMNTVAKNASLHEYRQASGFEAVLGYLYLIGERERLKYLLSVAKKATDEEK